MSVLDRFLDSPWAYLTGQVFLHFLWQGLAIAGVLFALQRPLARRSADARYLASALALVAMVLAPLLTLAWLWEAPQPTSSHFALAGPAGGIQSHMPALALFWLLGACLEQVRLCIGWWRARSLRQRQTRPLDARFEPMLQELVRRLGIRPSVRFLESARVSGPAVVGWLSPVVLVPTAALARLSPEQLRLVLAHELAHIKRHDYLVNFIQASIEAVLFFHPAVHWVSHRLRVEREFCCDDLAVGEGRDPLTYARALERLESLRSDEPRLALASTGGNLMQRIRRLIDPNPTPSKRGLALGALPISLIVGTLLSTTAFGLMGRDPVTEPAVAPHDEQEHEHRAAPSQDLERRIAELKREIAELEDRMHELRGRREARSRDNQAPRWRERTRSNRNPMENLPFGEHEHEHEDFEFDHEFHFDHDFDFDFDFDPDFNFEFDHEFPSGQSFEFDHEALKRHIHENVERGMHGARGANRQLHRWFSSGSDQEEHRDNHWLHAPHDDSEHDHDAEDPRWNRFFEREPSPEREARFRWRMHSDDDHGQEPRWSEEREELPHRVREHLHRARGEREDNQRTPRAERSYRERRPSTPRWDEDHSLSDEIREHVHEHLRGHADGSGNIDAKELQRVIEEKVRLHLERMGVDGQKLHREYREHAHDDDHEGHGSNQRRDLRRAPRRPQPPTAPEPLAELHELESLGALAELAELAELADMPELQGLAELSELAELAPMVELEPMAELAELAELADLADLSELSQLHRLAELGELAELEAMVDLEPLMEMEWLDHVLDALEPLGELEEMVDEPAEQR